MNVGFLHTGFSFLLNADCGNPALWRGRQHDVRRMPGFIARQEREQAIQPDPRESLRRDADPHFFPDSGTNWRVRPICSVHSAIELPTHSCICLRNCNRVR